jgi:hypothetical protein
MEVAIKSMRDLPVCGYPDKGPETFRWPKPEDLLGMPKGLPIAVAKMKWKATVGSTFTLM